MVVFVVLYQLTTECEAALSHPRAESAHLGQVLEVGQEDMPLQGLFRGKEVPLPSLLQSIAADAGQTACHLLASPGGLLVVELWVAVVM